MHTLIIGVERRGFSLSLRREETGHIALLLKTPNKPVAECVERFEEPSLVSALETYHHLASVFEA